MKSTKIRQRVAFVSLVAALVSSTAVALVPNAALAVPAGGYRALVAQVAPSVVYIEVSSHLNAEDFRKSLPENLQRQFDNLPPGQTEAMPLHSLGSGFLISTDGQIVTNAHVVDGADKVSVKLEDGRKFDATVIGSDPLTDIALLKIDAKIEFPAVRFGKSADMQVGDEVVAVGNPFGLGGTVTSGIVSAVARNINSGPYDDYIQTDASINKGNSGGPLFNAVGEVIGVNSAIFSPDGGSVGIGFAVPSDLVQQVVADLKDDGTVTRGWLGVQIKPMSDEIATVLGYSAPKGAVIEAVTKDSPAQKAGLENGDIILSINDIPITEVRDLTRAVAKLAPDSKADVVVLHKGKQITIPVQIGTLAPSET
jgi:serine protease Do